jgi:hypothetical protein
VARSRPPRTAVCVLRVEARGSAGVLITVTTTPDAASGLPGSTKAVASVEEAPTLVGRFLHAYKDENVYNNGTS